MENEKMNGITWKLEWSNKKTKKTSSDEIYLFVFFFLQPGNFTSLNNGTAMLVKNPKNLYKIGIGRLQENESCRKLDDIEDAINDSLRT